jgi:glycosyltransferase
MKILAFYLPQFHPIKENNEWWGEGFTEWTNVKTSKPTYKGHKQPRVPLNDNYYDLLDVNVLEWQANLAKEYGIYGFVYYHYWFEDGLLLEKPAELMLKNKSVDIPFCFSWANHTWSRNWANKSDQILRKQTYGGQEEWKKHFYYLLPFFKDERYIRIDSKPLMILYNPLTVKEFPEMIMCWQELAQKEGLKGVTICHQENRFNHELNENKRYYDYGIEFQMNAAVREFIKNSKAFAMERILNRVADKIPILRCKATTMHYSYDTIWKLVLNKKPFGETWFPGAFVDWDNTPRRKNRGQICTDVTPEKFRKYLSLQIKRARDIYKKEYLFMFAWNEWGESGYLEPDELYGYKMLEAVRDALVENNEFPSFG